MSRFNKIPSALFLLLLFLFPQVQKGIHDFEHRLDAHCDSASELHFHQLEHVCSICDISISAGIENDITGYRNIVAPVNFEYIEIPATFVFSDCLCTLPSRAPPVFIS